MSSEKMHYKIHNKEMLAVIKALQKWWDVLLNLQAVSFIAITDHCTLKYFIIKWLLNSQQARWADIVTDYNFKFIYHSETVNVVADTLTRKHNELVTQKKKNIAAHTQLFLNSDCVIALMKKDSLNNKQSSDNWAKLTENPYQLMNWILQINWSHKSLNQYHQLTKKKEWDWKLQDSLLT